MRLRTGLGWIGVVCGVVATAALFCAAPAAATHSVFCQENVATCSESSQYPSEVWLTTTLEEPGIYGEFEIPGLVTISCTHGKVAGSMVASAEGPLTGTLTTFWFANKCSPEGCAVNSAVSVKTPWEAAAIGGGDGTITISSLVLPITCTKSPSFNCEYKAGSIKAEFEGGIYAEAFVRSEETPLSYVSGSFACAVFSKANLRFRTVVREPTFFEGGTYLTN